MSSNYRKQRNKSGWNKAYQGQTSSKKKELTDYVYYTGGSKQASDFEKTTEFLLNYIKGEFQNGNDIAESLRQREYADPKEWYPSMEHNNETDPIRRETREKEIQITFKAELDAALKRKSTYETNKTKAYALIWEQCSTLLQGQIEQRTDYENEIYNNPIKLIESIKEQTLNYSKTRYAMEILDNSLTTFLLIKQNDDELHEYVKRFKLAKQVLESHLGGLVKFTKYIKQLPGYDSKDDKNNTKLYSETWEQFAAYKLVKNANKEKFGNVIRHLRERKGIGKDEFPKTVISAINTLNTYKSTQLTRNANNRTNTSNRRENQDDNKDEEDTKPLKFTFMNIEGRCYCCGQKDHKSPQCPKKNVIKKENWAITKAKQSHVLQVNNAESNASQKSTTSSVSSKSVGWANSHIIMNHNTQLKNKILLDSGSSTTLFCNQKYCENIQNTAEPISVHTNGGTFGIDQKCNIPDLGNGYYNNKAMTNIIGLKDMRSKYRVTYDSDKGAEFRVHTPSGIIIFPEMEEGIYAIDMSTKTNSTKRDDSNKENGNFFNALNNKHSYPYSTKQLKQAEKAKSILYALGLPSYRDLKNIHRMNIIPDAKISMKDIEAAERIFGHDIGTLKGLTTRKKAQKMIDPTIVLPEDLYEIQKDVTLAIDVIKVNQHYFLTTISLHIYYRTAQYLNKLTAANLAQALDEVIQTYKKANLNIRIIKQTMNFNVSSESCKN